MKKMKYMLAILAMMMAAADAVAQSEPACLMIYKKGSGYRSYYPADVIDSISFTDTDYEVGVYCYEPKVNEQGELEIKVSAGAGISIKQLKCALVDASLSDGDILSSYMMGKLTLRDVTETNRTTYTVDDGSYKAVAFGYDATGQYRGYAISDVVSFPYEVNPLLLYNQTGTNGWGYGYDWGYGSIMRIREVMGEDFTCSSESDYNWYNNWEKNRNLGEKFITAQLVWNYYYNAIQKTNQVILDFERRSKANNNYQQILGEAYAMRAYYHLDAARMYEFLANDGTSNINADGNNVLGLTIPIMETTDDTINVARTSREEMVLFILQDLVKAEKLLTGTTSADKTLPDLSVIYGLMARTYLWNEDYSNARIWAQKAINLGDHNILSSQEWLDTTTGFNDSSISSWMMAMSYTEDCDAVQSGICNWASWCCNEQSFGYTGTNMGIYTIASKSFYDKINDKDFRKLSYKAPSGSTLSGQEPYISDETYSNMPDYASFKFRPGQGNIDDPYTGAVVDVPLMRIEEMYFISMEAQAQNGNLSAACAELNAFMQNRQSDYSFTASTQKDVIDEIMKQKRIEFWGEGINYFDYKRLNMPVTRAYDGSNYYTAARFNTTTRPAWMNFVIVNTAARTNPALTGWNNPDPSGCYTAQ